MKNGGREPYNRVRGTQKYEDFIGKQPKVLKGQLAKLWQMDLMLFIEA